MNREEHLQWCKDRSLEYVKNGDLTNAYASMASDLRKHPETEMHSGIALGMNLLMAGHLDTTDKMEKYINGFN